MKQFNYQSIFDIWVRLEMNVDHSELNKELKENRKYAEKIEKAFDS